MYQSPTTYQGKWENLFTSFIPSRKVLKTLILHFYVVKEVEVLQRGDTGSLMPLF